jgi:hypothetical protein
MAKVEISEEEYARSKRTFDVLSRIAKNPKAARLVEQAHKMVDESVATPLSDSDKAEDERFTKLEKTVTDFLQAQREEKDKNDADSKKAAFDSKWASGRQTLKDRGWTEEGVKALEEMMASKGIVDHDDARKIFETDNPPPPPASPVGVGSYNFFGDVTDKDKNLKALIEGRGDSPLANAAADQMARDALQDFRQQVARGR